jgi:type I restriction enzyme S subunit
MGQSPPGETYNDSGEGLPFYQGIRDFGFRFPAKRVYCTAPTRIAQTGDVLLSVRAPVGSLNVAGEECAVGRGVAALRIKGQHYGFLYYLMKETQWGWQKFEAEGTVFCSATKTDVQSFAVVFPPPQTLSRFNEMVLPLDKMIRNNEEQTCFLATIRDALMPKLLSGEIRVKDAERFVEEVA